MPLDIEAVRRRGQGGAKEEGAPVKGEQMAINRVTRTQKPGAVLVRVLTEWGTVFPGSVIALIVLFALCTGALEYGFGAAHLVLLTGLVGAAIFRAAVPPSAISIWVERTRALDMVALPLAAIAVVASALGPDAQVVFPLVLMLLVWAAASLGRFSLIAAVSFAVLVEIGRFYARGGWGFGEVVMHLLFIGGFAAGGLVLLRAEVTAARKRAQAEKSAQETATLDEARSLGIEAETEPTEAAPVDLGSRIQVLGTSIDRVLALARDAIGARSAVLFTREGRDHMRLRRALSPEGELLNHQPIAAKEGLLAVVSRQGLEPGSPPVLRVSPIEGRTAMLPYYTKTPARIKSLMALPLRRGTELVATLWFDRGAGEGFSEADANRALRTGQLISDMLETERALLATESRSLVLDQLLQAVKTMSEAFTPQEVYRAVLTAAGSLADLQFAALLTPASPGEARVMHATGDGAQSCIGRTVPVGSSLATMVLKTPAAVPPSRVWNHAHGPLLGADIGPRLRDGDPVLALPLQLRGKPVGSLVVSARTALSDEQTDLLKLLSCQAAIAVEHAQALSDLQSRATTDALTGLDNRTTVLSKLEQSLARTRRQEQELAVLVLDIDHFKQVNDTHGHQVGDRVLGQVAATLGKCKRLNDSVGRIGGEEFLVVLENTAEEGTRLVAERVREQISRLSFPAEAGVFTVTASIGFAMSPRDGGRASELVKRADNALYQAKNNGRNQVRGHRDRVRRPLPTNLAPVGA